MRQVTAATYKGRGNASCLPVPLLHTKESRFKVQNAVQEECRCRLWAEKGNNRGQIALGAVSQHRHVRRFN